MKNNVIGYFSLSNADLGRMSLILKMLEKIDVNKIVNNHVCVKEAEC